MKSKNGNRSSEIIKNKVMTSLKNMFHKFLPLRALYIYMNPKDVEDGIYSPENLAQFLLRLILRHYHKFGYSITVSEDVAKYLLDGSAEQASIMELTMRSNFVEYSSLVDFVEWRKHLLLDLLPKKKLFFWTNAEQKTKTAELCKLSHCPSNFTDHLVPANTEANLRKFHLPETFTQEATEHLLEVFSNIDLEARHDIAITIFGFHRSLMGIGEDARTLFDMLCSAGFRVELYDCSYPEHERDPRSCFYEMFETASPTAEVAIMCMPVFEMGKLLPKLTLEFFRTRYTIGYWPWELSRVPKEWREIINLVDEIWASSTFLVDVFRRECNKPIFLVPLNVKIHPRVNNCPDIANRERKLDNYFISVFDFNSSIERKNPIASIKAFKSAFSEGENCCSLILKTINGRQNQQSLSSIKSEIGEDKRIKIIDGSMPKQQLQNLIKCSSGFLSLHRSEGFGRLLVEAMLLGVPVIATDWSGSRDFVKQEYAFPISYSLRLVDPSEYPYPIGFWADPNIEHAAQILRLLAQDHNKCEYKSRLAQEFVSKKFSAGHISTTLKIRLSLIKKK